VNFDTPPFTELPLNGGTADSQLTGVPWSVAHQYGVVLYCPAKFRHAHIRMNHHLIGIELDPGIVSLGIDGGPAVSTIQRSRTFYFVPSGSSIEVRKETPIEYMLLTFDPRFAKSLPPFPSHVLDNMVDSAFAATALALRRQFLTGGGVLQLAIELARVALVALSRAYRTGAYRNALTRPGGWLNAIRIRRAISFIDEHHSSKITVEDIAHAVGNISAGHFAYAFESTLGQSPHQYVLEQRVRRAREMLADESISIAEVAYAVGFSSQAHMTSIFTRRLGITPAQIRTSAGRLSW
jgi:AraC family transcriptional regulator